MANKMTYTNFDHDFDQNFDLLWRFCFLMTGKSSDAKDLTFRTFLILGAHKVANELQPEFNAKCFIFSSAVELIQHYYLQKPRRKISRKRLNAQQLPFEMDDQALAFLHEPIDFRFVALLSEYDFSLAQISSMMRISIPRLKRIVERSTYKPPVNIVPPAGLKSDMSAQIYLRFSERAVSFENNIHKAKRIFERLLPWLTLAILLLFAFAYWYVEQL